MKGKYEIINIMQDRFSLNEAPLLLASFASRLEVSSLWVHCKALLDYLFKDF
jgi:hypothetical protein